MTRRQERRRKELLDDLKDRTGYYHLKEEALDRNMWREEALNLSSDRLPVDDDDNVRQVDSLFNCGHNK